MNLDQTIDHMKKLMKTFKYSVPKAYFKLREQFPREPLPSLKQVAREMSARHRPKPNPYKELQKLRKLRQAREKKLLEQPKQKKLFEALEMDDEFETEMEMLDIGSHQDLYNFIMTASTPLVFIFYEGVEPAFIKNVQFIVNEFAANTGVDNIKFLSHERLYKLFNKIYNVVLNAEKEKTWNPKVREWFEEIHKWADGIFRKKELLAKAKQGKSKMEENSDFDNKLEEALEEVAAPITEPKPKEMPPKTRPGPPKKGPEKRPEPFRPPQPKVIPDTKNATVSGVVADAPAEAPTKTVPGTKPKAPSKPAPSKPDPFRPPQPKVMPDTKNVMVVFLEDYEDEAHPENVKFWNELPKGRKHLYAQHPIMSVYGNKLSKASFEHTSKRTRETGVNLGQAMDIFKQIIQVEHDHRDELEQLSRKAVAMVWGIDEDMLKPRLTDEVDVNETTEDRPEIELTPELRDQVNKRITMNALTQGSAVDMMMTLHHLVTPELKKISPELLRLYDQIASLSHQYFWMMSISEIAKQLAGMAVGSEKVNYDKDGNPEVVAKAFIFPVLVQELSKGVMELISHHGLADLDAKATEIVLQHADRLEDEPWLIQVGPEMWRQFLQAMPDKAKKAEIVTALATRPPKEVHDIIMTILDNPDKAKDIILRLLEAEPISPEPEPEPREDDLGWAEKQF